MKLLIVIPAYNEEQIIAQTISSLQNTSIHPNPHILVIDDGSQDQTFQTAKKTGVKVLKHSLNRGLGGALGTGLEYARRQGYDLMVTFDADGQHDPKDLQKVIKPILNLKADVVIGSRTISQQGKIPPDRQIIIKLSNLLTFLLFRQKTSDSLSGFRGFSKKAIQKIHIRTEKMEVSNEFFAEIKRHKLNLKEVPIKIIYTKYSRSKGQSNLNSINIVVKLFLRLFRW